MSTEAQKKASRRYYQEHKEYYKQKAVEEIKNVRSERNDYKQRIEKAIEYIRSNEWAKDYEISNCRTHLLNILQNGSEDNEKEQF